VPQLIHCVPQLIHICAMTHSLPLRRIHKVKGDLKAVGCWCVHLLSPCCYHSLPYCINVCVWERVYVCVCVPVHMYVYMCSFACVCTYICIYVCVCIYICMYTHTNLHTSERFMTVFGISRSLLIDLDVDLKIFDTFKRLQSSSTSCEGKSFTIASFLMVSTGLGRTNAR